MEQLEGKYVAVQIYNFLTKLKVTTFFAPTIKVFATLAYRERAARDKMKVGKKWERKDQSGTAVATGDLLSSCHFPGKETIIFPGRLCSAKWTR